MRGAITLATVFTAALVAAAAPPELVDKGPIVAPLKEPTFFSVKADPKKKLHLAKTYDTKTFSVVRLWNDDPATFDFQVFPKANGTVYFAFFQDGETPLVVEVKAGTGADPVKPPPTDPPVTPTGVYYFAVIRENQLTKEVADAMRLPAWDEVREKGHSVKDIPVAELPTGIPLPASLPSLVVLRQNADGKTWTAPIKTGPLPTTNDQIRSLLK